MNRSKSGRRPDDHVPTAPATLDGSTPPPPPALKKPLRPNQCRGYARNAVAVGIPEIVDAFVSEAKKGSVSHFNQLTKFGGFDHRPQSPPATRRGKSLAQWLLDDLRRHEASVVAVNQKRLAAKPDSGNPASD